MCYLSWDSEWINHGLFLPVDVPRFRVTYASRKRFAFFDTPEKRSEIIEAPDLEDAQAKAKIKLASNYPIDWTVSVEEMED